MTCQALLSPKGDNAVIEEEFKFPPLKVAEALEVMKFKNQGSIRQKVCLHPLFGVALEGHCARGDPVPEGQVEQPRDLWLQLVPEGRACPRWATRGTRRGGEA